MNSESNVGGLVELVAKWRAKEGGGCTGVRRKCADELEAAISAHGQPVVDEDMVERALMAYQAVSYGCNTRALRAALTAAITGATP